MLEAVSISFLPDEYIATALVVKLNGPCGHRHAAAPGAYPDGWRDPQGRSQVCQQLAIFHARLVDLIVQLLILSKYWPIQTPKRIWSSLLPRALLLAFWRRLLRGSSYGPATAISLMGWQRIEPLSGPATQIASLRRRVTSALASLGSIGTTVQP